MANVHKKVKEQPAFIKVISITNFRNLWFAQICSQIATNTLLFILAIRIYNTTNSNTAVSGLYLVYGIPAVFFGLIAGTIVDKLDKRNILRFCDIARAVLILGFILFPTNLIMIYVLMFINTFITQFYVPAEAPTIPYLVSENEIVTANSLFSFTYYSSLAIGSVLAGPILRLMGATGVFIFLSILFLLAAYNVNKLPAKIMVTRPLKDIFSASFEYLFKRLMANVREGLGYVKKSAVLKDALFLLMGTQVILAILGTLGPGFADRVLHIDIRDSSVVIMGPVVLGLVLGALFVGNLGNKFKAKQLIQIGILSAGIVLIIVSLLFRFSRIIHVDWFTQKLISLLIVIVLFFFLGAANSFLDVPANTILQSEANDQMRGRVYGLLSAAVGGLGVLPVILGGILADTIGVGRVILMLGILITLFGLYRIQKKSL
jgi:MFS transporter, DHA3 family, macrolide efflux protein